MRRLSLVMVAVCLVALVAAEVAQAQVYFGGGRGGWGGRGGTSWGIGVGTPQYGLSYGRSPWGGTGWSGYVGQPYYGGYGYGRPYYGGYGYGGYPASGWGGTYYTPGWTYSYPSTGYYSSGSGYYPSGGYYSNMPQTSGTWGYQASYPQTYGTGASQASYNEPSRNQAMLRVSVPDTAARVWVEGQPTQQMGTTRVFVSPALEPGTYHYNVKASWMENGREVTREQKVTVEPGREVAVNFATGRGAPGTAQEFQDQNRAIQDPLRDPARPNERDRDLNRDLNRDINRDLNRDRDLNKDLNRTQERGAVTPVSGTPAQTTPPAQATPTSAKVVRVDKDQLVVSMTDGGKERTYRIANDTPIMLNGTKSALTALTPGMQLTITTRPGSTTEVTRIEATNPRP